MDLRETYDRLLGQEHVLTDYLDSLGPDRGKQGADGILGQRAAAALDDVHSARLRLRGSLDVIETREALTGSVGRAREGNPVPAPRFA